MAELTPPVDEDLARLLGNPYFRSLAQADFWRVLEAPTEPAPRVLQADSEGGDAD